jgi:hypothetical protein
MRPITANFFYVMPDCILVWLIAASSRHNGTPYIRRSAMRQLVIDILLKLAKMDVDAKELTAQLEAQSLLVAALLVQAKQDNTLTITETVQDAIVTASRSSTEFLQSDVDLLLTHINRLLAVAQYVEVKGKMAEEE